MAATAGRIASSTRMCRGSALWVVTVAAGFVVRLTFTAYTLDGAKRHTLMKVRDGATRQADLLVRNYGGNAPQTVSSSQNVMLIEFIMPVEKSRTHDYEIDNQGFVAVFEAVGKFGDSGLFLAVWLSSKYVSNVGLLFVHCATYIVISHMLTFPCVTCKTCPLRHMSPTPCDSCPYITCTTISAASVMRNLCLMFNLTHALPAQCITCSLHCICRLVDTLIDNGLCFSIKCYPGTATW